jgi:hypothetical protein
MSLEKRMKLACLFAKGENRKRLENNLKALAILDDFQSVFKQKLTRKGERQCANIATKPHI